MAKTENVQYKTILEAWYPLLPPVPNRPPKCFESMVRFEEWLAAAPSTITRNGFCEDCTRGMQRQMISEERCEFPDTDFPGQRDMDAAVQGKAPAELNADARDILTRKNNKQNGVALKTRRLNLSEAICAAADPKAKKAELEKMMDAHTKVVAHACDCTLWEWRKYEAGEVEIPRAVWKAFQEYEEQQQSVLRENQKAMRKLAGDLVALHGKSREEQAE